MHLSLPPKQIQPILYPLHRSLRIPILLRVPGRMEEAAHLHLHLFTVAKQDEQCYAAPQRSTRLPQSLDVPEKEKAWVGLRRHGGA